MQPDDPGQLAQLVEPLRSRVAALLEAAGDAVWINSGRRSLEEQVSLRRAHCGTSYYDVWQKPASQCRPPTARPGHSDHETGEAVDLGGNMTLAGQLAKGLGLSRPVKGENWHFEVDPSARQGTWDPPGPVDGVGFDLPDLPGPGDVAGAVTDALGNVLGALVDPLLEGAARIALVGVLVAGGVALVVLGGVRGAQTITERGTDLWP